VRDDDWCGEWKICPAAAVVPAQQVAVAALALVAAPQADADDDGDARRCRCRRPNRRSRWRPTDPTRAIRPRARRRGGIGIAAHGACAGDDAQS
jgi:hypothetical protein